eukprot:9012667-Pyramimonas_sp.AAC.1
MSLVTSALANQSARARPSSGWLNSRGLLRQSAVGSGSLSRAPRPSRFGRGCPCFCGCDDGFKLGDGGLEFDTLLLEVVGALRDA